MISPLSILLHSFTSFIAAAAFGVMFNTPRRLLFQCGLTGMLGWITYVLLDFQFDAVPASVAATFVVGAVSQMLARFYKQPVILFSVSGIIPIVPGGLAYNAMRNFVQGDYNLAMQMAAKALLISGSIAIGLILSEVLREMLVWLAKVRLKKKNKKKKKNS